MSNKTKVAITTIALLIGVVTLIFYFTKQEKKSHFHLIDHVSEADIVYHTDFIKLLDEAIQYNSKIEKSISNNIALNELKSTILKSGLNLDKTYFTLSISELKYGSFYAEITDSVLLEASFNRLSNFFNINPLNGSEVLYISGNTALSIEKHSKYIKINFGKGSLNALSDKSLLAGKFLKNLLKQSNFGVINTTGTPQIDPTDYATFSYSFIEDFSLFINWNVDENHPLKANPNNEIPIYPSQKEKVSALMHFDIKHLDSTINPFLKKKGKTLINQLPIAAIKLLELWNGQASVQLGGKSIQETIQYITEFDDDFNQIETKIVKTDSVPDIGIFWGSFNPKESLNLTYQLPNVKREQEKLQIALLPPLITQTDSNSIKASTSQIDFNTKKRESLLYINVDIPGLIGEMKVEKKSNKSIHFHINLKDWNALRNPKSLNISSFW